MLPDLQGRIRRWADALVALPQRLQVPLALLLALILHALLILAAWLWPMLVNLLEHYSLLPRGCTLAARSIPPPTEKKALEITISTPTPKPEIEDKPLTAAEQKQLQEQFEQLPVEIQRQFIDVEGLAKKKNLSKRALFESWADSVAGSKKLGIGELPSQDGRELPFKDFKTQQASRTDPQNIAEADLQNRPAQLPAPIPAGGGAPPLYKPQPISRPDLEMAARTGKSPPTAQTNTVIPTPTPEPVQVASAQPPPSLKNVLEASEDQIPLFIRRPQAAIDIPPMRPVPTATPRPTPLTAAAPTPLTTPRPTPAMAQTTPKPTLTEPPKPTPPPIAATQPRPTPVKNPGYSMQKEQTKIEGGGTQIGDSGVDAVATARGKYKQTMRMLVDSRWRRLVDARMALVQTGTVSVSFAIDKNGKLIRFRLESNSSNSAHAMVVEEAIRATRFQPPPPETLRNGVFEDDFNFVIY